MAASISNSLISIPSLISLRTCTTNDLTKAHSLCILPCNKRAWPVCSSRLLDRAYRSNHGPSRIGRRGLSSRCGATKDKEVDRRAVDKSKILKEDPYGTIEDVMSETVVCVCADDTLESILEHLEKYTGLPVVDEDQKCIGVISDKDIVRFIKQKNPANDEEAEAILQNKVGDCMTSPAITVRKKAAVAYVAGLMLNHKVHRLPVVDKSEKVIGIVTRQDIYEPLMPAVDPLYKKRDLDETTLAEWHDLGDY